MRPILLLTIALLCSATVDLQATAPTTTGRIVFVSHDFGEAWVYRPRTARDQSVDAIFIIAHGTPGENEKAADTAKKFIERWTDFAEEHNLILIAPAFDRPRYRAAYGGYRGLFGRDIGADEFVERLVSAERDNFTITEDKLLLYGHSAGGQFACRFLMMHPDRVQAVILSAPGRYAFPDPAAPWPYGIGRFDRMLVWEKDSSKISKREVVEALPAEQITQAAMTPIAVLVGADDLEAQPSRPAHDGATRVELAQQWVRDMKKVAVSQGKQPRITLELIPNVGHNSGRLTPHCQKALRELMKPRDGAPTGKEEQRLLPTAR